MTQIVSLSRARQCAQLAEQADGPLTNLLDAAQGFLEKYCGTQFTGSEGQDLVEAICLMAAALLDARDRGDLTSETLKDYSVTYGTSAMRSIMPLAVIALASGYRAWATPTNV